MIARLARWLRREAGRGLEFHEEVVAGGPEAFMEVRHLVLRGGNPAIGARLAALARERHQLAHIVTPHAWRNRLRREYLAGHYPQHYARMRGVADHFGRSLDNDRIDASQLLYQLGVPGCTAVFYPPACTRPRRGLLSRNFDFTTATVLRRNCGGRQPPSVSRPYIVEMYPDQGYPSLYLCCFDLLGGVVDGINSRGLAVATLADDELPFFAAPDPAWNQGVGLHELLIMRYLLDNCADTTEAGAALLSLKHYYSISPLHYLVADARGRSFVWERSAGGNRDFLYAGNGRPQVVSNFLFHRHRPDRPLPRPDDDKGFMYSRYRTMQEILHRHKGAFTTTAVKAAAAAVQFTAPAVPGQAAVRTLWHSLYDTRKRRLEIDFYLGERRSGTVGGAPEIRRSGYLSFSLEGRNGG